MVTSTAHAEFKIANDALGAEDKFSQSPGRTYLTAGCIPQKVPMPKGFPGARWVRCNDFKYAKKTMTETKFFSCNDLLPNAVISKITIDRHRAKKWSSMQFSCRQVDQDGTLTGPEKQTPPLFTYRKPGKRTHLRFKSNMLPIGLVEIAPLMQFKETMWAFGLNHRPAHDIVQSGRTGRLGRNYFVGNIGPKPLPRLTTSYDWNCPPGMVLTGLALGHPQQTEEIRRPSTSTRNAER